MAYTHVILYQTNIYGAFYGQDRPRKFTNCTLRSGDLSIHLRARNWTTHVDAIRSIKAVCVKVLQLFVGEHQSSVLNLIHYTVNLTKCDAGWSLLNRFRCRVNVEGGSSCFKTANHGLSNNQQSHSHCRVIAVESEGHPRSWNRHSVHSYTGVKPGFRCL